MTSTRLSMIASFTARRILWLFHKRAVGLRGSKSSVARLSGALNGAELNISLSRVVQRTQQVTQSTTRRGSVKSSRELKNFSGSFFCAMAKEIGTAQRDTTGNRAGVHDYSISAFAL